MAFESLTDRFSGIFKKLSGQSRLTEKNMDDMLKEIRIALLEADVNFKVVKSFTNDVKEKALGQDVYNKVNPSQMLVKICHDEIEELLGKDNTELSYAKNGTTTIMLVGLQGGKVDGTVGENVAAALFGEERLKQTAVGSEVVDGGLNLPAEIGERFVEHRETAIAQLVARSIAFQV